MKKAFEHVGRYDFWCIFGSGIIFVIAWIVNVLLVENNFLTAFREFSKQQADWSFLLIFILVVIGYFVGIILQTIAKISFDLTKRFGFEKAFRCSDFLSNLYESNHHMKQSDFDKQYDYLKHIGKTKRIDVYHSLYGMSRSLFVGVILLTFILMPAYLNSLKEFLLLIGINSVLAILLFIRAKMYFDRWINYVLVEYRLCMRDKKYIKSKCKYVKVRKIK